MNLLKKYKNMPQQVKASMWFVVSNVMLKGISFITLPIFSRLLTTSEYGIVAVYQSWVSIISIITTLTIWGGVFSVGLVKHEKRVFEMMSSFQGMATSITIVVGVLTTFLLYDFLKQVFQLPQMLILCVFLDVVSQVPFNLWSSEQRYRYHYRVIILVTVINSILNPLISYFAVIHSDHKAEARIITGLVLQVILGIVFFIINQSKGKKFYSGEFWKWGFKFNIVLVPHYLSMQILNQSDRIMINNICGASDAGIYSVAYNFAMLLSLVTSGVNSSLTPHIYQCIKSGNTKKLPAQTTLVILVMAFMTIGLIAIIPDFFHLLLPESYYPALSVIPPVTAGAFFLFLYPLFGAIEFYYEENKYVTLASVVGAALNIILNLIFINLCGYQAAAYTTLFCYVAFTFFHYLFMKKVMRKKNATVEIYNMKHIFLISAAVVVCSIVMQLVYDTIVIRWCIIAAILILAFIKRAYLIDAYKAIKKK